MNKEIYKKYQNGRIYYKEYSDNASISSMVLLLNTEPVKNLSLDSDNDINFNLDDFIHTFPLIMGFDFEYARYMFGPYRHEDDVESIKYYIKGIFYG